MNGQCSRAAPYLVARRANNAGLTSSKPKKVISRFKRWGLGMHWISLIFSCALAATAAVAAPRSTIVVTKVRPSSRPEATYAFSIINPREVDVSVKAFARATQITAIPANLSCKGVAITGGFSRRSGDNLKPEGLIRTATGVLSNLANWRDGGVLSISGGEARITRIATWRATTSTAETALQARPLLVFDGKVDDPLNDHSRWNRVAVGTMRDGSVVLIGAFRPHNNAVTLREFAQDAIAVLGPDLISLLNMDGGPSAFMAWQDERLMPSQGVVTTYICAEGR